MTTTTYGIVLGDLGPALVISLGADGSAVIGPVLPVGVPPLALNTSTDIALLHYVGTDNIAREVSLTIASASLGQVSRAWAPGDLSLAGLYKAQVKIIRVGDTSYPRTLPSAGSLSVNWVVFPAFGPADPPGGPMLNSSGGDVVAGTPVYFTSSVRFGLGSNVTDLAHATVRGIVVDALIGNGNVGNVIQSGPLSLSANQWDAIAGTTGGLAKGVAVYLADGALTTAVPFTASAYYVLIGIASNVNELDIRIGAPVVIP